MLNLCTTTQNGQARTAALAVAAAAEAVPAGIVPYASAGSLLILGEEQQALAAAKCLKQQGNIHCTIVNMAAGEAPRVNLTGYLGAFQLTLAPPNEQQKFDLVLDLTASPFIDSQLSPPGYYSPGDDAAALQQALDEIPGLTGEFEKPQYFHYNASICAHGRSGMTACTRCLDACPTDAITSLGDSIEVNPGLCQGAGSCATACPSGAITYSYPRLSDSLDCLRALLKAYREKGGTDAVVLFHDREAGHDVVADVAAQLPENILPIEVEELGSVGMDSWLATLAYGASTVVLLGVPGLPAAVVKEINAQLDVAHALLDGMGYHAGVLRYTERQGVELVDSLGHLSRPGNPKPAGFAGLNEKRTVIRLAVEHLFDCAPATRPLISLPTGAPFGDVLLDKARCTLCLACVSQCPASALSAGDETPQLGFIEANCVQCGLCCRTCPEDAIAISPRYLYDFQVRNTRRVLYEEEPFACVVCGKPFATRSVIEQITKKMRGHAMFQGAALERIKMCEDCRVMDIYDDKGGDAQSTIGPSSSGGAS